MPIQPSQEYVNIAVDENMEFISTHMLSTTEMCILLKLKLSSLNYIKIRNAMKSRGFEKYKRVRREPYVDMDVWMTPEMLEAHNKRTRNWWTRSVPNDPPEMKAIRKEINARRAEELSRKDNSDN